MKAVIAYLVLVALSSAHGEPEGLARELVFPVNPPRHVINPGPAGVPLFSAHLDERLQEWSRMVGEELDQRTLTEGELARLRAGGLGQRHPQVLTLELKLGIIRSQLENRTRQLELLRKSLLSSLDNMQGWTKESRTGLEKVITEVNRQLDLLKK